MTTKERRRRRYLSEGHTTDLTRTQLVAHKTINPAATFPCQRVFFGVLEHSDRALIRQRCSDKELELEGELDRLKQFVPIAWSSATWCRFELYTDLHRADEQGHV